MNKIKLILVLILFIPFSPSQSQVDMIKVQFAGKPDFSLRWNITTMDPTFDPDIFGSGVEEGSEADLQFLEDLTEVEAYFDETDPNLFSFVDTGNRIRLNDLGGAQRTTLNEIYGIIFPMKAYLDNGTVLQTYDIISHVYSSYSITQIENAIEVNLQDILLQYDAKTGILLKQVIYDTNGNMAEIKLVPEIANPVELKFGVLPGDHFEFQVSRLDENFDHNIFDENDEPFILGQIWNLEVNEGVESVTGIVYSDFNIPEVLLLDRDLFSFTLPNGTKTNDYEEFAGVIYPLEGNFVVDGASWGLSDFITSTYSFFEDNLSEDEDNFILKIDVGITIEIGVEKTTGVLSYEKVTDGSGNVLEIVRVLPETESSSSSSEMKSDDPSESGPTLPLPYPYLITSFSLVIIMFMRKKQGLKV